MSVATRGAARDRDWRERGRDLGFGAGIGRAMATLGRSVSPSARLHGDRHGMQCRRPSFAEAKEGNSAQSTRQCRAKGRRGNRTGWRARLKGLTQRLWPTSPIVATDRFSCHEGGPQLFERNPLGCTPCPQWGNGRRPRCRVNDRFPGWPTFRSRRVVPSRVRGRDAHCWTPPHRSGRADFPHPAPTSGV